MASSPLLNFPELLAPIPGDSPAGQPLAFDLKDKLTKGRVEINPDDYKADDPLRPRERKAADWSGIVKVAREALAKNSKDLLLAARLTEALTRDVAARQDQFVKKGEVTNGFTGLRDGLRLIRQMVEQCWDRLTPPIEDGDLEVRAGPFYWLDDADRGAQFPNTLRGVPVLYTKDGVRYSFHDWKESQSKDGKGKVTVADWDKAMQATEAALCEAVADDLNQSYEELNQIVKLLNAKMERAAPGMTALRQAIEEVRTLAQQIWEKRRPAPAPKTDEKADGKAGGAAPGPAKPAHTRAEVYRQLTQAAHVLRELEPHSPIPYLILRCVELGAMPFPDLIKELVRDAKLVADLNRELGIKDGAKAGAKAAPAAQAASG
jgi:type VI secretion system ImpA family protein